MAGLIRLSHVRFSRHFRGTASPTFESLRTTNFSKSLFTLFELSRIFHKGRQYPSKIADFGLRENLKANLLSIICHIV
jgi:hypothetical protein